MEMSDFYSICIYVNILNILWYLLYFHGFIISTLSTSQSIPTSDTFSWILQRQLKCDWVNHKLIPCTLLRKASNLSITMAQFSFSQSLSSSQLISQMSIIMGFSHKANVQYPFYALFQICCCCCSGHMPPHCITDFADILTFFTLLQFNQSNIFLGIHFSNCPYLHYFYVLMSFQPLWWIFPFYTYTSIFMLHINFY